MANGSRITRIEDSALVLSARQGCQESCNELVRRYRGATLLAARQVTGAKESAEDVAQAAFIQAFQQLRQLQNPARFAPWLYTITRNIAQRVSRRESRISPIEDSKLDLLIETQGDGLIPNPLETLLASEETHAVRSVLKELAQPIRIVMQLYYYEQWDVAQIAEFLSLARTTVKWRLHSGRRQMSKLMNEMFQEETSRMENLNNETK